MLIKTIPVGQLETNCYIVTDEKTLECAVIDPGDESGAILDYVEDNHLKCLAILLTHGHHDHVGAVLPVMEETGAPVYIHRLDSDPQPGESGMKFPLPKGGSYYDDGDEVRVGELVFRVMHTPGHTPGGVTLVCGNAVFCGDTLFRGSCGRTDLPGGDMDAELLSLRRICALPGDYEVYPGHMDQTSLERERNYNYYCREAMGK